MSIITVYSLERQNFRIEPYKDLLRDGLMVATAKFLGEDLDKVLVDFKRWGHPEPYNAPDILLRAEAPSSFREKILSWDLVLDSAWNQIVTDYEIPLERPWRIQILPSVIDTHGYSTFEH